MHGKEEVQSVPFEGSAMSDQAYFAPPPNASISSGEVRLSGTELPMTVRDAATFLGVRAQTVYLWAERRQIPHLCVMGRNIRFLKSDLESFRAQFKQEVENGTAK
jgi:excisionase family DNA binding protein